MDRMPFWETCESVVKQGLIILIALIVLLGCTASRNETQTADIEKLEIGETVYVCGCPMMCCNSISKTAGGRCACNHPLRKATVSRVRDGRVYVKIDDGREKRFFIKNR
jgi:hypothetical protein